MKLKRKYAVIINIGLAVLAALWFGHYYRLAVVSGRSMEPSLSQGDFVVVKMGVMPQRGDIAVIDSKVLHKRIIKRVIAVEIIYDMFIHRHRNISDCLHAVMPVTTDQNISCRCICTDAFYTLWCDLCPYGTIFFIYYFI